MSDKLVKLEDIAEVIDSLHKTPKYSDSGFPMVRVTDVQYGKLSLENTFRVNKDVFDEFSKRHLPQKGDIVITRVGSYGNTAIVDNVNFCLGQNTAFIVPKNINPQYLYAVLNSHALKFQIDSLVVGSTQKTLSIKAIKQLEIPRFDEKIENIIAKIISTFDDKIQLNNETNATLEAIAQAIFKSWFIDFDPVHAKAHAHQQALAEGKTDSQAQHLANVEAMQVISGKTADELAHMEQTQPSDYAQLLATADAFPSAFDDEGLPLGWDMSTIGEEIESVGGATPSTKNPGFWEDGDINWTTPKDLSGLVDRVLIQTDRKITEEGLKKISSGLLPIDTVLMSSRAPVGYLALAKVPVAVNQGYIAMKCNKTLTPFYVLQWCHANMDEIKIRSSGTTFKEISKKNFRTIECIVPDNNIISIYSKKIANVYQKIEYNTLENMNLTKTRDTLLPKLLSGEV